MNNDNGPTPGFLGPDGESVNPTDSGNSVFDSKEFIGDVKDDKAAKPKKELTIPPILMKWQIWAAVCIVIIISSIVVIISTIASRNAQALAKYDEAIAKINAQKSNYDDRFETFMREFFDIKEDESVSRRLYPSKEEQTTAKSSCLKRFGATDDDLSVVEKYRSGKELADAGVDVKKATEQANRVVESYYSAEASLESCREDLYTIVSNYFDITIGDFSASESGSSMLAFHQPIAIQYKGERAIQYMRLNYKFFDRSGVELKFTPIISISLPASGEAIERDLFRYTETAGYNVLKDSNTAKTRYTPKLMGVSVTYVSADYDNQA